MAHHNSISIEREALQGQYRVVRLHHHIRHLHNQTETSFKALNVSDHAVMLVVMVV